MIKSIIKRDGRVVLYDEGKIASAILKAMEAAQEGDASQAAAVANAVEAALEERCGAQPPQIEQIQDEVESQLMQMGFDNAAKKYILYRASRTRVREMNTRLMKVFDELTHADATASDMKRSNANIDGDTPMGTMLQYGSEAAKDYYDKYLLTPEQSRAHREGWIHIHLRPHHHLLPNRPAQAVQRRFLHGPRFSARAQRHPELFRPGMYRHPVQSERPARRPEHRKL